MWGVVESFTAPFRCYDAALGPELEALVTRFRPAPFQLPSMPSMPGGSAEGAPSSADGGGGSIGNINGGGGGLLGGHHIGCGNEILDDHPVAVGIGVLKAGDGIHQPHIGKVPQILGHGADGT